MRVGAMVVGILFAIWTFFEALLVGGLSGDNEEMSAAAGLGLGASFFVGIAAVLVLAIPLVSSILFAIGSGLSFGAGAGGYENHYLYGIIFAALAVMAFFGWIGKRNARRRERVKEQVQAERDARYEALLTAQTRQAQQPSPQIIDVPSATRARAEPVPLSTRGNYCTSCGHQNATGTKFCAECGNPMSAPAGPS
jgi:hypothetical protein